MAPEMRKLADLTPYERNARTHSEAQIAQIAASMREFGWTNPILVDEEGLVIAGHGRLAGAKALGWDEGPVIVARGWSEAQKRAYVIADNKIAENAGWDAGMLALEFGAIGSMGLDMALLGFSQAERRTIIASQAEGLTDPDEVPPVPAEPVTRMGDVWCLGEHRLTCGDSTSSEAVARVLAGERPNLMVTDPPYGVEYDAAWRTKIIDPKSGTKKSVRATGKVLNDDKADWRAAWELFPGSVAYVWHAAIYSSLVDASLVAAEFELRAQIIWAKSQMVIGRGNYHWKHEPCWYAVRKGKAANWQGGRDQTTLWEIEKPRRSETGHSTQKPIDCMRRPILNNSVAGDIVYDPFLGSGTTLMAAQMEGRRCYGLELNPAYCDVIVARWEAFTGLKATLERTMEAA